MALRKDFVDHLLNCTRKLRWPNSSKKAQVDNIPVASINLIFRIKIYYPSLVLVQPRKTCPCLTERLLMGRKESNQTKQNKSRSTCHQLVKGVEDISWLLENWLLEKLYK